MNALSSSFAVCPGSRARLWLVCAAAVIAMLGCPELRADSVSQAVLDQISQLQAEKSSRTPAQLKLDSQIHYALKLSRGQAIAPGVSSVTPALTREPDGRIKVDIQAVVSADLLNSISQSGGTMINSVPRFNAIQAVIPLAFAEQLAGRADVKLVRPATKPEQDTGSVDSEGDTTHGAILARAGFGVDGAGVKVGVLSDSVDHLAASQATGDLPPNVTVLPGQSGVPASGEGTAMLEIIADLAPGATLYFATAGGGEANFAQNILDLRAAGCDILVDDIRYLTEPVFQDGPVARAVNAVTTDGAWYFASAGNSGNKAHNTSGTWEGDFVDGGAAGAPVNGKNGNLHMFATNTYNTVTQGGSAALLFWSDPLGGSTNDYDLYVVDGTGNTLIAGSTNPQTGTQDPFEGLVGGFTNGMRLVIVKASGDPRFLHIDSGRGRLEENTTGFARGHSAATNAFATAAIDVATAYPGLFVGGAQNPVEDFSSDGPRRMFFQENGTAITPGNFLATGGAVRQYPTIGAADGVQTSVPGFQPFFGTSAAAPHAAAIAALVKSYNPLLTPAEGRAILTTNALDNEATGLDITGGYGILSALASLTATPAPMVPVLQVQTNYVLGGNGNGVVDVDECNDLYLPLVNVGMVTATNVSVTISTTNKGVFIPQPTALYPDIPTNTVATNLTAFKLGTSPNFLCGTRINLKVEIKSDSGTKINQLQLSTGTNAPSATFFSFMPAVIPDNSFLGTNSPVFVPFVSGAIQKVTASIYTVHPFDADLTFQLIGPDGTTVLLTANHGNGPNYGLACFPISSRTLFDDDATNTIASGRPPFVGAFRPDQSLGAFSGKSGTNATGIWQLKAVDGAAGNVGVLECWALNVYTSGCAAGGGQCPGVDLSLSMTDVPDPAVISSNLVYTVTVTNNGPNTARGVVITHNVPGAMQFVSALASQGGASYSAGVVTATLGNLGVGGVASVTVTVIPALSGTFFSSASVASTDPELNPLDNVATVGTVIVPPLSDLAVGLADFPDPTVVGGQLTYAISVTNLGPASASGVVVSNSLPGSVRIDSVSSSQGPPPVVAGNVVLFNPGLLPKDAFATATIVVTPLTYGVINAVAYASAVQPDPYQANNTALAATTVGQASDLAIAMSALPNPVVLNSNLTYQITVTNLGPNTATNVVVSQNLPTGITVSQVSLSQGSYSLSGSSLLCSLGTIVVGGSANVRVVAATARIGTLTSSATVTSSQTDPNSANNAASASANVSPPFINIVAAGVTLVDENFYPADGSVEAGETVTIQFRLQNVGNVANTNLVATLLPTGGVTSPGAPQTYGILRPVGIPGGAPVARQFRFTAAAAAADTIVATFQLQDGLNSLPPATFTFTLPKVASFANTDPIAVPAADAQNQVGPANPYPSVINVSGVTGQVGKVTVTLAEISHSFAHDINALLVGPTGVKTLILSHAADLSYVTNATLTFDSSADSPLPAMGEMSSGTWQPSVYPPEVTFSNPAPGGPYSTLLSDFNGLNPNGQWSLYVFDDNTGDNGVIAGGWSLALTSVAPVNQLADVGLRATASPDSVLVEDALTYTFAVTNAGPATATGVNFSNTLPSFASFVSAVISQGNWTTNGNTLLANFATLPVGGSATLTAVVQPQVGCPAQLTNTGYVAAFETDIHSGDNRAVVVTTVNLPQTSLGVSMTALPDPVIVGSNLTYTITVANAGPGKALEVRVTDSLPTGTVFVTASASQGTWTETGGTLVASLGALAAGGSAAVTVVLAPSAAGPLTNSAVVTTASKDTQASRSVSAVSQVVNPAAKILAAGATLLSESYSPPNGTIDPGETVTVSLALANEGVLDTANLTATLVESGGVTMPSGPANYGALAPGGSAVARAFSFTASSVASGGIAAALRLRDGGNDLGTVVFTFNLPATTSLSGTNAIGIPDHGTAAPYPSTVVITGIAGVVGKVSVVLHGLTHSFPSDVNVLLAGPANSHVLLMSHCGGGANIENVDLTFDDSASEVLPNLGVLSTGTYKPTQYGSVSFPVPAPLAPHGTSLAAFKGIAPNGTWALYVLDDSFGDLGVITGGWTLNVTTIQPLSTPPRLVAAFSDSLLHLLLLGVPGNVYVIEASTDLSTWTAIYTATAATDGTVSFTDPDSAIIGTRFYRALRQGP
ncbi:MAG TPA: proprotein convertase P-domain-containing protein [Verrucomicrobiae bacterium]